MNDEPHQIDIDYLLLADSAETVGGKLYMLGGSWNALHLGSFPGRPAKPFFLVAGVSVPWTHTNRRFALGMDLVDTDGNQLGDTLTAEMESGRPPGVRPGTTMIVPLAVGAQPEFDKAGRYVFNVSIDSEPRRSISFEIT